jgi:hypothetical protein
MGGLEFKHQNGGILCADKKLKKHGHTIVGQSLDAHIAVVILMTAVRSLIIQSVIAVKVQGGADRLNRRPK